MKNIKAKCGLVFCTIFLCLFNILNVNAITQQSIDNYRIRVHTTSTTTTVKPSSNYKIYIDGVENAYKISGSQYFEITKSGNSITVKPTGGTVIGTGNIIEFKKTVTSTQVIELKTGSSYVKYPDNMKFSLSSDKSVINCINVTDIETYIKGVIPHEMGASAPLEAMKAQAVTARTVGVARVNKYASEGYDVRNDTSDQVYKGYNATYNASTHNVSKAVDQTKGIVLKYGKSLVTGTFYSNNGGMTASDANVWSSGTQTPYYKSKVDSYDTYLHPSTTGWAKLNYSESYTAQELKNVILNSSSAYSGYFKGNYMTPAFNGLSDKFDVKVNTSVNGYVTSITLSDDTGRSYNVKNYANRWVFGLRSQQFNLTKSTVLALKSDAITRQDNNVYVKSANEIKWANNNSLYIKDSTGTTKPYPTNYTFDGKGYGHGIGMSQNGAMNRADAGHTYKQILDFYYEGTTTAANYGN